MILLFFLEKNLIILFVKIFIAKCSNFFKATFYTIFSERHTLKYFKLKGFSIY